MQVMLHAHRRIAIPPETRLVVQAYRQRDRFGDLRHPGNRRELARWLTQRRAGNFGVLRLDADMVADEIVSGPPTVGSAVGIVLRAYAQRFGKVRWGDKRPGYWQDVDVLLRLFPDAQIVHVVRDGRSCVASLKRMRWWRQGFDAAVATWLMAQEWVHRDTRGLAPGWFHQLRYEDLVADPEAELERLCCFLGEEFDPAMLETTKAARYAVPSPKTHDHHSRLRIPVDTAAVESWREGLEPDEIGLIEFVAGRRLRSCGYELSGMGKRPGPMRVTSFALEYGHRQLALHHRRLVDTAERRRDEAPVAALLTRRQIELAC